MQNMNNGDKLKNLSRVERADKKRSTKRKKVNLLMALFLLVAVPSIGMSFAQESKDEIVEIDKAIEMQDLTQEDSNQDDSVDGEQVLSEDTNELVSEENTQATEKSNINSTNNVENNSSIKTENKPSTESNTTNNTNSQNSTTVSKPNGSTSKPSGSKPNESKPSGSKPSRPNPSGNINNVDTSPYPDINVDTTKPVESTPEEKVKKYCANGFGFSTGIYRNLNSYYNGDSNATFWKEILGTSFASHKMRYNVSLNIGGDAITVSGTNVTINLSKINIAVKYDSAHTQSAIQKGGVSGDKISSLTGGISLESKFSSQFATVEQSVINEANEDIDFLMSSFTSVIRSKIAQATGTNVTVSLN